MVAYSFKDRFGVPIMTGEKRQTVRGPRKRHARPGEALQLFTGMRTRYCLKLLQQDPICTAVEPIAIAIARHNPQIITDIRLGDRLLSDADIEAFAAADGFGPADGDARYRMGEFWLAAHYTGDDEMVFEGVVIRWEAR